MVQFLEHFYTTGIIQYQNYLCERGNEKNGKGRLIDWLIEFSHNKLICQKFSPWSQGRKVPSGRGKRTTYTPYKEKTVTMQKYSKKRHLQRNSTTKKEKKGENTCGCRGACIWKNEELLLNEGPRLQ